jgi:diacylglycerol kinase family enzyme
VRVSLLYNEQAGDGVPLNRLRDAIARHGHELVRVAARTDELDALLDNCPDLVAAAGGDGTIAAAARRLAGSSVPLAILPFGTANNIARSVGADGPIDELVDRWASGRRRALDLGTVQAGWGTQHFVESVGSGLISGGIVEMKTKSDESGAAASRIAEAVRRYGHVLERLKAERLNITVDGVDASGNFLVVEVLNIGSIGPNLAFADADPSDGLLRVVLAGDEHRDELRRYLEQRAAGRQHPLVLPTLEGRQITMQGAADLHVDDRILPSNGVVSIDVDAGAVQLMA